MPTHLKKIVTRILLFAAIARRSKRRLSRIAKRSCTRRYSRRALARVTKGDGCHFSVSAAEAGSKKLAMTAPPATEAGRAAQGCRLMKDVPAS
jgi:hypothetical protein